MAEVHVIGTLLGAAGFPRAELCARWSVVAGEGWALVEGEDSGQTQVDLPEVTEDAVNVQAVHSNEAEGPKIHNGYGFMHVPTTPGKHELECVTWRPTGSTMDQHNSESGRHPPSASDQTDYDPQDATSGPQQQQALNHAELLVAHGDATDVEAGKLGDELGAGGSVVKEDLSA
ncbi:B9 domain-containing protein 2, partial [Cladochytrium tenue]